VEVLERDPRAERAAARIAGRDHPEREAPVRPGGERDAGFDRPVREIDPGPVEPGQVDEQAFVRKRHRQLRGDAFRIAGVAQRHLEADDVTLQGTARLDRDRRAAEVGPGHGSRAGYGCWAAK
jgi:hypothetical protein